DLLSFPTRRSSDLFPVLLIPLTTVSICCENTHLFFFIGIKKKSISEFYVKKICMSKRLTNLLNICRFLSGSGRELYHFSRTHWKARCYEFWLSHCLQAVC